MANISDGPIYIQGETFSTNDDFTVVGDVSLARTRTENQEQAPNEPGFDEFGLRPGYTGEGYLDLNGGAGLKAELIFDAPQGSYDFTMRLAAGSQTRPVDIVVAGQTVNIPSTNTGTWDNWETRSITFVIGPDDTGPHTLQIFQVAANAAPNIDSMALTVSGDPVNFAAPEISSDPNFEIPENTTIVGQVLATDLDGDALSYQIVGGDDAGLVSIDAQGNLTLNDAADFEAPTDAGADNVLNVTVGVSDGVDTVTQEVSITITDVAPELATPTIDQIVIQAESGTITGPAGSDTAFRTRDSNPETTDAALDEFDLRPGYSGTGYADFGSASGDTITWAATVAEAGLYTLHINYATSSTRPLDVVAGDSAARVDFTGSDFAEWQTLAVDVALTAGSNTISLAIPAGRSNGPNVDAVALTSQGAAANFPPVFDAELSEVVVDENTTAVLGNFSATDTGTPTDAVTYDLAGDDTAAFTVDAAGDLSFGAAPDFEAATDTGGDNVYNVDVTATDGTTVITRSVTVTVTDVDEAPTGLTLTPVAFDENVAGAVVATITLDDPDTSYVIGDFVLSGDDAASFEVTGDATAGFQVQLISTLALDFEAGDFPSVTVTAGGLQSTVTATPTDVDETVIITLTPVEFEENVPGAVIAAIEIADPDPSAVYDATNVTVDDPRFEVIMDDGLKLKLVAGTALDAEAAQPTLTISAGGSSSTFVPAPLDVAEPQVFLFSEAGVTGYTPQDRPGPTTSVDVSDDGRAITLDGNLWKRAAIESVTLSEQSVLRVTIEVLSDSEIVAIGFDTNDNAFDDDQNLYQLAGLQSFPRGIDLRGTGTVDGSLVTFEIPLGAQAGLTFDSIVLINDDDDGANGVGATTFSDVEVFVPDTTGENTAPRVVGGGIADFGIDEASSVEIDLPFVDDDGDALTFGFTATLDGAPATLPLSIEAGTLSGDLAGTEPGVYTVTVSANDGAGGITTDSFELTVRNVNAAPVADQGTAFEPFFGAVGEPITAIDLEQFRSAFSDEDGDTLEFVVTGLPGGLEIAENVIFGTPTDAGDGSFAVAMRDPSGAQSSAIEIDLVLDAPQTGDVTTVEAEDFTGLGASDTFFATGQAGASDNQLIRVSSNQDGRVTSLLSANGVTEGWYRVAIDVYDELDGTATYQLSIDDTALSAAGATFDDAGIFLNPTAARGNAGQSGNQKRISFEDAVFIDSESVLTFAGQADAELLRLDRVLLTRVDEPDVAPEAVTLTASPVAENLAGAIIGTLSAVDPDGDSAAITFSVDPASIFEIDGDTLRLKPADSFDFELGATVTVDVTATDVSGASTVATLDIQITDVDEAPAAPGLVTGTVDENAAGTVIGALVADDPEGGVITFTVADARFVVDGSGNLALADGVSLNFEETETVTVSVTADDGVNQTSGDVVVTVADVNDAPTLADGASLADVAVGSGTEARVDLSGLGATDEDGDILSFEARLVSGDPLPAGFSIDGAELVVADTVASGAYAIEVFATDGTAETAPVELSVTVGATAPFVPFAIQAEDPALTDLLVLDTDADANDTTIRDADNPESNPALQPSGLRPDFSGTGYLDFGDTPGDQITFAVDVPVAGQYDLNIRYASQGAARPLDLAVNAAAFGALAFTTTDPDGTGPVEGFDTWAFLTQTVTLGAGSNDISLAIPAGANTGPNIDRIEITEAGSGPIPAADLSADEDGNLAADAPAEVAADALDTVELTLAGVDADVVLYEVSTDGGATFAAVTPVATADTQVLTLDLSAFAGADAVTIDVRLTDDADNTVQRSVTVDVTETVAPPFTQVIQLENRDGSITIDDTTPGTGEGDPLATQFRDADNIEGIQPGRDDGLWNGYSGAGYLDMGGNIGDAFSFDVEAPVAGTYSLTFRYVQAGGTTPERPLDLSVNGVDAATIPFASTGTGSTGWTNWTDVTVDVTLTEGTNTVRLENTIANGPNLDRVTITRDGEIPDTPSEPGPRDTVRINFQDGSAPVADGYLVANFEGYADQGNGQTYGFVTEGSVLDGDATSNTPIDALLYPAIAINERSGGDFDGFDPRLTGYAHTDLRTSYPDGAANRVAFELAVENGWYEVTVAVGDTGGPNDSDNQLLIEGLLSSSYIPTDIYKSELVTVQVKVEDGNLTLAAPNGEVTELQYLEVRALPDLTPDDAREAPEDYASFFDARAISGVGATERQVDLDPDGGGRAEDVDPGADIFLGINVVDGRGGALLESLQDGSVKLFNTLTGAEVAIGINTTGGFDSLTISPVQALDENTSYTLVIDGFRDRGETADDTSATREFQKFSTSFTTGEAAEVVDREVAFVDTVELDGAANGSFGVTSIEMSPDGTSLYAVTIGGQIKRWDIDQGTGAIDTASEEVFTPLGDFVVDANDPANGRRGFIGITFDPEDPNTLWVTDNAPIPLSGRDNSVPDFSGRISKVTLGENGSVEDAVITPYITGLPRSNGDHVTNSLEFRANPDAGSAGEPDFLLYLIQGSNSAMGAPDSAWGQRPERLLNAAVMEIDHTRTDVPPGGFDVSTEPLPDDNLNRRFNDSDDNLKNGGILIQNAQDASLNGNYLHFDAQGVASVRTGEDFASAIVEEYYDPFADDAVLRIFSTGQRNAYDLVWHSNGFLYVPTNGSAAGGNTPDDPSTAVDEATFGVEKQDDYLFRVVEGGYYGHPNPLRDEFILNGGEADNSRYPGTGVEPDANYDVEGSYSLGENRSPNGAFEYTSDIFGNSLQGAVLFTEYSGGNDVRVVTLGADGTPTDDFVLQRPDGSTIIYADPLDVVQGNNGQIYLVTLNRSNGQSQLIRLDPAPGGVTQDNTADAGGDLTLSVIDSSDAANIIFAVAGLDDDIETITVSFDNGATSEVVSLDAQNRFAADLSGTVGAVTALLVVTDEVPNTANASISFTPGETTASTFIDAVSFTVLSSLTGAAATVIRRLDDDSTHEAGSSNDANGDGLNDGHDGISYLDPNGGPEDKASFVVNAAGAGTYSLVFRMAANNDRAVTFISGTEEVTVTVNTGDFTTWVDFPVELTLEDGPNTIIINQPGPTGPNIDSVTVVPVDVAEDVTADEGGDLAIALADASDRANTVFTVAGLDPDIVALNVSFNGGAAQPVTVTDGSFTVNTSALSGPVSVSLAVTDEVPNFATATTDIVLAEVVTNDGTTEINGLTYVLYEAETAALTGPQIIGDDAGEEDRGAQGGAFVDFDGTADQTITWTVEVAEDGTYGVDILYALSTTKDARPMQLAVDGAPVIVLPFVPNSGDAETDWGPQSTVLTLGAGVHTISVTAPGANGPNVDQLRITEAPFVQGDPDADIEIESLDPAFFDNRLHFSWLDNDSGSNPDRQFKENAFVEISNSGTNPLEFQSAELTGPFELADATVFDDLILAAGESITVEVLFDRSAYTAGGSGVTGVFEGALSLRTNDDDTPLATVDLAGFWQARDEGGQEPNINEVWDVFGFGNEIEGLSLQGGGESSVLDFYDIYLPEDETEVLSPYWRLAEGVSEAQITQIAAFHGGGGATINIHAPGNKGADVDLTNHAGNENQTLLPLQGNGSFATATITNGLIPDGWQGDNIFGIEVANLSTDPTLNPTGNGAPSQAELDARFPGYTVSGGVVFDPDGNEVPDGYTVRMFQAVDKQGNIIPNTYLGVMDYTGINYDYNDNMFVIEGVAPVGNGAGFAIAGLDAAAADDRLVFSAIDSPQATQETRDTASFTIENDGTGVLTVQSFAVDGAFSVSGLAAGDTIAAGGSATVTVTFDGLDGVDDNQAALFEGSLAITTNIGTQSINLAGLAQIQSEGGEEPNVAQIVQAFGYSTDVAQGLLANGGVVEEVGDEVLLPYLQRLDGAQPIEIIQLAAYLQQGNVARLNVHGLDSADTTELFAQDDNQGQTVLPDGLVSGTGDTGSVAAATIDNDDPFGLYISVDGRPTFASWTDPEINRIDPDFGDLVSDDAGHLIRFFEARDADGNVVPGTYIGIQDYPGAGNFDYNDHMFIITNVQGYALTSGDDANGNDINDALETDADGDGILAFFDGDDTPATEQAAFNDTATPWAVDATGLTLQASQFDTGGQGVAYNDTTPASLGDTSVRPGEAVDISVGTGAIGFTAADEWVEYTIDVATAGAYELSFNSSSPLSGRALTATFAQAGGVYETVTAQVPNTGAFTVYEDTAPVTVDLQSGVQVLRVNFDLNQQDLAAFTLTPAGPLNTAPVTTGITDAPDASEGGAYSFDVAGFFSDADEDALTFTASGLPAGLEVSESGVISGTPTVDGSFTVTVSASDGVASVGTSFTLVVDDTPLPTDQAPFPGPVAPAFADGVLTIDASNYDDGGQGISYNDAAGLQGGSTGGRTGSDVEQTADGDIGWIGNGEWLEYTVDVFASGPYDLDLQLSLGSGGGRTATVEFYKPGEAAPYASSGALANPSTGSFAQFESRTAEDIVLDAGLQIVRVTFNGGSQDFRAFTLTAQTSTNTPPTAVEITGVPDAAEADSYLFDVAGFFSDADGDALSFTATGLPDGLSISPSGLITGTLPFVSEDTAFVVTVTASDGTADVAQSFALTVEDTATGQTPFPAIGAPVIGEDAVFIEAASFDNGGQGVAWNDDAGLNSGGQALRADTDVELTGSAQDIGFVEAGEWVEYTINVAEAGTYDLSVNAKTPIGGNSVTVSIEGGPALASFALVDSNGGSTGFDGTTFTETAPQQIQLEAGVQTLRVLFDGTPALNGYLLDYRGLTLDKVEDIVVEPNAIGQSGRLEITQASGDQWFTVTFDQPLEDPSVVVGPITDNGFQPAVARVRNVTETGFEVQVDEWDYLDGAHITETISWLAIEAGTHQIGGQTVVAGSASAAGSDTALSFGTSVFGSDAPVVLAQVVTANDPAAVTGQVDNVTSSGFEIDLDREQASSTAHGTETVSWIAVEGGGTSVDGLISGLETGVDEVPQTIDFGAAFDSEDSFVFLANMQTENGPDPAALRLADVSADSATVFVEEEQSADEEVGHVDETVGYVALEEGVIFGDNLLI